MNRKTSLYIAGAATVLLGLMGAHSAHAQGEISYVRWTEPKEKAFSLDVPRGWKVTGGLNRAGKTDVRQSITVEAPGQTALISMGDPGLPTFATLGNLEQQMGVREGTTNNVLGNFTELYLHFMPALEFNHWYLQNRLSQAVDDLQIGDEKDLSEAAQKMEANAQRQMGGKAPIKISCALTEFTGRSKTTGKPVNAAILTMTQFLGSTTPGFGGTWHAVPVVVGVVDDENKEARQKQVIAIFTRMQQSRRNNPIWQRKENQRVTQVVQAAIKRSQVAARRAAPAGGGAVGGTSRPDIMSSYWRRNAARAAQQHQFINYLRDEHDVVTPSGGVVTVPD